jgi:uncharacterized membrane protein YgcG
MARLHPIGHAREFLVEALEPRRFLSAGISAAFTGDLPTAVAPGAAAHLTVRLSLPKDSSNATKVASVWFFASPTPSSSPEMVRLNWRAAIVRLRPGRSATVGLTFTPAPALHGPEYLLAEIDGRGSRVDEPAVLIAAPRPTTFFQSFVDLSGEIVDQPLNQLLAAPRHPAQGAASVLVFNSGTVAAAGSMSITLHATSGSKFEAGLPVVGSLTVKKLNLGAGNSQVFQVQFKLPAATPAGAYHLFGVISGSHGIAESNLTNNVAGSVAPIEVTNTPVPLAQGQVHHYHHHYVCDTHDNGFFIGDGVVVTAGAAVLGGGDYAAPTLDLADTSTPTTQPTTAPTTMPTDSTSDGSASGNSSDSTDSNSGGGGDSGGGSDTSDW